PERAATGPRRARPRSEVAPPSSSARRGLAIRVAAIVAAAGLAYVLLVPTRSPGAIAPAALRAAGAAGCGDVTHPAAEAPGGLHLRPGQDHTYDQHPASSGYHDPSPLPPDPHVYTRPVREPRAVHNLEHAYVLIYHRDLAPEAMDALAAFARDEARVIMAPYPGLPSGTGLALVAWNTLWECPPSTTADQAVAIARGFVDAYRGTSVAPEAPRGLLGRFLQR
ncbi:MAG: DUF3105 domain-containing protein, partial [Candidatus Velamenicoccus archaeovorus]